jgi:hypothetical protein
MMTKAERMAIANGFICVLNILEVLINPYIMKDEKLINATMDYITSTEKQLKELRGDD